MNATMCRSYSLFEDGDRQLSTNFKVKEFRCKDGTDCIFIAEDLAYWLQRVRYHFNRPLTITSAYRTPEYNAKVGGAKKSQHMYGTAADFYIAGVRPEDIAEFLETLVPNTCGIGVYDDFVHFDVRRKRSRWKG